MRIDTRYGKAVAQVLTVSSRVEYQYRFGCVETLSASELAREWMGVMLRPESKLLRLRTRFNNNAVVMAENKALKDLTQVSSQTSTFRDRVSLLLFEFSIGSHSFIVKTNQSNFGFSFLGLSPVGFPPRRTAR